jgi:hypothetical protein
MITFSNFEDFKESYELALKKGDETFTFEGTPVLTSYAKYVIMYFEMKISEMEKNY